MKFKYIIENKLHEDLQLVKFKYNNYKHDKNPRVKVLDFNYKGQPHQKNYGEREDLLGFNLNYFKNKRYASKAIDDIDSFARMLSATKDEKYKRMKHFYPEVTKYIRRYNRKHIVGLKSKGTVMFKKDNYDSLITKDRESY